MKKKIIYAALASVMLLCSACGKQSDIQDNETVANKNAATSSNAADTPAADSNTSANTSANDGSADTDASENNTDSAQAADNAQQQLSVSVELQTQKNDYAEGDTLIYSSTIIYPVVSIEGNEAAADKINADIQARVDSFLGDTITLDSAREVYRAYPAEDSEYPFIEYTSDLDFVVNRADSNVISFTTTYYDFAGGPHGNYAVIGINYSPQTGELIDFSELSQEPEAFHADTFAYIQELAATEAYQEMLFPSTSPEEIESVLYDEEAWYLSTSGLVFLSNPYALGPYAAGLIEFLIPYDALEEMGLKEEYQYAGNLTVPLKDGSSYTMDINGDGKEDTIQLYTSYEENADGTSDFAPHLVINGIDISQGYNEELSRLLPPWPTCTLYDMNPEDDTVEIALSVIQTNKAAGETYIVYSAFFRYEKDASITYLGMTRGAATDPTMDISTLSLSHPL